MGLAVSGWKAGFRGDAVHLAEAGGVPEFGDKAAVGFDAGGTEFDVAAGTGEGADGEAEGVCAVGVDELERVDDVALGFRHLLALLVADEAVDVDGAEGHLAFRKCRPIIIMRATQKKMMSNPVTRTSPG